MIPRKTRACCSIRWPCPPAIGLTEVGWDDNVVRVAKTDRPTGDFTATFSAALQAWFRLQRVKMRGRSRFDFVYFDKFSQFRSIDSDNSAHVDLLLGRLTPYVEGTWTNTPTVTSRSTFRCDVWSLTSARESTCGSLEKRGSAS